MKHVKKVETGQERIDPKDDEWEMDEDTDENWELCRRLGELVEADEAQMNVVNKPRVRQLEFADKLLRELVKGTCVRTEKRVHDPYPSMGCLSVIGREIVIEDMKRFFEAAELADNIDIYSKTDGTLQIDLTFNGLMFKGGSNG